MTEETLPEPKRPFHVLNTLEGVENFHSGHFTKDAADDCCKKANIEAERLGIKSRYVVKPFVA